MIGGTTGRSVGDCHMAENICQRAWEHLFPWRCLLTKQMEFFGVVLSFFSQMSHNALHSVQLEKRQVQVRKGDLGHVVLNRLCGKKMAVNQDVPEFFFNRWTENSNK